MALITIPDKNSGDELTATEFNELLDALKDGTLEINTSEVKVAGSALALNNLSDMNYTSPNDGDTLVWDNTAGEYIDSDINGINGTLAVNAGGTGSASGFTSGELLIGNGYSPVQTLTPPSGDLVGTTETQTISNKTVDYVQAYSAFNGQGTISTNTTFDFNSDTNFTGTLGGDVTLTISNLSDGQRGQITLAYDSTAQRTVTWSGIDKWVGGSAPSTPSASGEKLVVTVINDGTHTLADGGIAS